MGGFEIVPSETPTLSVRWRIVGHVSIGLRLNDAGLFVGNPNCHLRNPPAALDSLLKPVAHDLALNRDEVLHRAAARKAVHCNPLPQRATRSPRRTPGESRCAQRVRKPRHIGAGGMPAV